MILTFDARIVDAEIHCRIGSDSALLAPVFCCSNFVPSRVVAGGTLLRAVAGYTEVALPDIAAGGAVTLVMAYAEQGYAPRNRAWLPLGPYLRTPDGPVPLPPMHAGVTPSDRADDPAAAGLRLIPQPTRWEAANGTVSVTHFATDDPVFQQANDLALRFGLAPLTGTGGMPVKVSILAEMPPESYDLTIDASASRIIAADATGVFHAAISLLNLRETHGGEVPLGHITDRPRFGWRGQHLDCARHFYQPATLLRLLDLMTLFKLNRFHWHFADDEAFRLQVDCAPDLWRTTEFRGEGCVVPGVFGGGIRSGGSYSRADVALVLERAAALHIEVLPEIEVPAHAFAINRAIAGLRDPDDTGHEASIQGYPENIINPALPATWALIEPLSVEVASLFPIGMLHLGCDEMPPGAWAGSPAVDRLKAAEGLVSQDDVQGWTMARLAAHLGHHGYRSAAWEEAAKGCQGGIGNGALLFSWTGQGPGVEAARMGHDVVMCPAQNTYLDMAHTSDAGDWGAAWAAFIALEDTVNWRPVPADAEDIAHRIVGVQGCFWSEFTTEDAEIEPMLAPRILGIANKAWDTNDSVDGPAMRGLAAAYGPVFDRIGWARHRGA